MKRAILALALLAGCIDRPVPAECPDDLGMHLLAKTRRGDFLPWAILGTTWVDDEGRCYYSDTCGRLIQILGLVHPETGAMCTDGKPTDAELSVNKGE